MEKKPTRIVNTKKSTENIKNFFFRKKAGPFIYITTKENEKKNYFEKWPQITIKYILLYKREPNEPVQTHG